MRVHNSISTSPESEFRINNNQIRNTPRKNNNVREKSTDFPDMIFIATPLCLQPHDLLRDVAQILSLVMRETAID